MTTINISSFLIFNSFFNRFVAYDVDMFGEPNFIGQYTVPVRCIKKGFRSVQLKNSYSEDLELAGIFFYCEYDTQRL